MVSRVEGVEPISDKGAENPKQRDASPLKIYLNWWEENLFRPNWGKIARSGENGLKYFCPSAGRKEDEMFEKILIATDLSAASDSIVNCAEGFKKIGAEKVYLCHALGLKHIEDLKYQMIPMVEPKLKKTKGHSGEGRIKNRNHHRTWNSSDRNQSPGRRKRGFIDCYRLAG